MEHFDDLQRDVTVLRHNTGSYIGGEWVAGEPAENETQMAAFPVTAASAKMFPEGTYITEDKRFYHTCTKVEYAQGDVITLDDIQYMIKDIQNRILEGYFVTYFAKRVAKEAADA